MGWLILAGSVWAVIFGTDATWAAGLCVLILSVIALLYDERARWPL